MAAKMAVKMVKNVVVFLNCIFKTF